MVGKATVGILGVVAALGGLAAVAGFAGGSLGPGLMTMEVMSDWLGVDRYQDEGSCDFWVVNMSNPSERIERSFACSFFWDWSLSKDGAAYVHEALWDVEEDEVFEVPEMERGNLEEWYRVNGAMLMEDALRFDASDEAGVLMPPPGARGNVTMGWVQSGGVYGGVEELVYPRDLREVGMVTLGGVEGVMWESAFEREETTWHGYEVFLTEKVEMVNDPRTGWVLEMQRYVLVEMTPSQMFDAWGVNVPGLFEEVGEPEPVMELVYETRPDVIPAHAQQAESFQRLMLPVEHQEPLTRIGVALAVLAGGLAGVVWVLVREPGEEADGVGGAKG